MSSPLQVIHGDRDETPNEVAARRIRQELAGQKRPPSQTAIAARIGMKQQALSRRLLGTVPFDLNEIYAVCEAAGIDPFYVLTGRRETPQPDGPDEGLSGEVRPKGFEPLTF
ncbi:helix-turn-helix transcriptional regulator [Nocardia sp. NPDC051911]|uniref:helix-turn-helix domain-containing protein n=1 Tax=Nocardia sp. NPDC051911 TaxID=3154648 RepID=UPI003448CC79